MTHTSIRLHVPRHVHLLAAVAFVVLVSSLIPGSARAAAPDRQAYASASAYSTECVEERARQVCTDTSLYVFTSDNGTDVCLSISTYAISRRGDYSFIGSESGCTTAATDAFTVDTKNVSSATLAPTVMTLNTYTCTRQGCQVTSSRDVTVAATFTGTGDVRTFSNRSTFDDGTCTYTFSGRGIGRDASASITLEGNLLEGSGFLSSSTSLTKVQCR